MVHVFMQECCRPKRRVLFLLQVSHVYRGHGGIKLPTKPAKHSTSNNATTYNTPYLPLLVFLFLPQFSISLNNGVVIHTAFSSFCSLSLLHLLLPIFYRVEICKGNVLCTRWSAGRHRRRVWLRRRGESRVWEGDGGAQYCVVPERTDLWCLFWGQVCRGSPMVYSGDFYYRDSD